MLFCSSLTVYIKTLVCKHVEEKIQHKTSQQKQQTKKHVPYLETLFWLGPTSISNYYGNLVINSTGSILSWSVYVLFIVCFFFSADIRYICQWYGVVSSLSCLFHLEHICIYSKIWLKQIFSGLKILFSGLSSFQKANAWDLAEV